MAIWMIYMFVVFLAIAGIFATPRYLRKRKNRLAGLTRGHLMIMDDHREINWKQFPPDQFTSTEYYLISEAYRVLDDDIYGKSFDEIQKAYAKEVMGETLLEFKRDHEYGT